MSRITLNTKCRLCRAQGTKLYLKGERCFSPKCPLEKKGAVPPGMHGVKRQSRVTDFGLQLKAKQQAKRIYGVNETQFRNYFLKAKTLPGLVGDNLLILLERRLDNLLTLAGLSLSRTHARQLISHRHVFVNGKKLNVSSYLVKVDDEISLDKKAGKLFGGTLKIDQKEYKTPDWMAVDRKNYSAKVLTLPSLTHTNQDIDINLIIEYYSR